jgi:hypothetical protein
MALKQFNILLIDLLKQQGWEITKKRVSTGYIIKGIKINDNFKDPDFIKGEIKYKKDLVTADTDLQDIYFDN